jgi:hypothetical protein
MENTLKKTFMAAYLLLAYPIIYSLTGALSGFLVGLLFSDTIHFVIRELTDSTRFDGVKLWQFGATAAFFASWFKPSSYTEN